MAALVVAVHRYLLARKTVFLPLAGVLILLCGFFSFRLIVHEDIRGLIPSSPPSLAERFLYLQRAPFMQIMNITVGGGADDPGPLADDLAAHLRSSEMPEVHTGPGSSFSPDSLTKLFFHAPAFLAPEAILAFGDKLDEASVDQALQRDKALLLTPSGLALRGLIAMDPLGLRDLLFKALASLGKPGGMEIREGRFTDPSGRYAMILAKPAAPMSDAIAASAVMTKITGALSELPEGTGSYITGSYRHTDANARVIKEDLSRVLPPSFIAVALLFFLFIRRAIGLVMFLVPVAAVCIAGVATAAIHGTVSGIVLGFGSVLLGITSDYAVHTYYAVSGSGRTEDNLASLTPPLLAGACTTCVAFIALMFSSIPAIRQMALFGFAGIAAALVMALTVLPLLLRPKGPALPHRLEGRDIRIRKFPAALLAGLCLLAALFCFATLRFDGDIRHLSFIPPEVKRDEEISREIWKTPRDLSLVVAAGDDMEQALRINDKVWERLQAYSSPEKKGIVSIAPLLPSEQRQRQSLEAWRELWRTKGPQALAAIADGAPKHGFSPAAFAPFEQWISGDPGIVTPDLLQVMGVGWLADMLISRADGLAVVYTILPEKFGMTAQLAGTLEDAGARVISGDSFREDMAKAAASEIFRFCLLALSANVIAVALVFRSLGKSVLVLLPMLAACAFTLTIFRAAGIAMTLFHAVALPLVMALSLDYGLFMLAALQGKMDMDTRKSVALSALTTVAGFGCLLFARHPALFSLGLTVTGGIASAFAVALWLLPALVSFDAQPRQVAALSGEKT